MSVATWVRSSGVLAVTAASTGFAAVPRAGMATGNHSQIRPSRLKLVSRSHCAK